MRIKVERDPEARRKQDLENLYKQAQMLIEMYGNLTNIEVIGILNLLIHSLAASTIKPIPPDDK